MGNIILASASPRRAELLHQLGLTFEVVVSGVTEDMAAESDPIKVAGQLALSKAKAVAATCKKEQAMIIAADTVVCVDGVLLGKPAAKEEALQMLQLLSGKNHQVMTGVSVIRMPDKKIWNHVETTTVYMRPISEAEMLWYIDSGEAWDKAGGYGIQGRAAVFVERIEGCYFNVVGLPLSALWRLLQEAGVVG